MRVRFRSDAVVWFMGVGFGVSANESEHGSEMAILRVLVAGPSEWVRDFCFGPGIPIGISYRVRGYWCLGQVLCFLQVRRTSIED